MYTRVQTLRPSVYSLKNKGKPRMCFFQEIDGVQESTPPRPSAPGLWTSLTPSTSAEPLRGQGSEVMGPRGYGGDPPRPPKPPREGQTQHNTSLFIAVYDPLCKSSVCVSAPRRSSKATSAERVCARRMWACKVRVCVRARVRAALMTDNSSFAFGSQCVCE